MKILESDILMLSTSQLAMDYILIGRSLPAGRKCE